VIDSTNQFGQPVMNGLAAIAGAAPQAAIYRAFNSLGWENFAEPVLDGTQADLLYAGPDGPGRAMVEQLIADIGLRPVWVGDLSQAPLVDNLGALWGALAFGQRRGRRIAFKVLGG
jgi:predicted dinucleotide-binding enzyme